MANIYQLKIDCDTHSFIDMQLLQDDLRHFETLVQDTYTVCAHPNELNKKRRFESEAARSPDTSEQPQPPKRGRSHTDRLNTPGTGHVDWSSVAGEDHPTYMPTPESRVPTYHAANTEGLPGSQIIVFDRQETIASNTPKVPQSPAANAQRSTTGHTVSDGAGVGVKTATVQQSSSHPLSLTGSPQQSQRTRSQSKQPTDSLQQPILLDLQHEYGIIREHVSRKDVDSGLPAIASVAALRDRMADLKNAAKMESEAWFSMVREIIEEELDRAGFAGLPTV